MKNQKEIKKRKDKQPDLRDPAWVDWFTNSVMNTLQEASADYFKRFDAEHDKKLHKELKAAGLE